MLVESLIKKKDETGQREIERKRIGIKRRERESEGNRKERERQS